MPGERVEIRTSRGQPFRVLALVLTFAGHLGLIAFFSAGDAAFGDAGEDIYRPSMRVVEMKLEGSNEIALGSGKIDHWEEQRPAIAKESGPSGHQKAKTSHVFLPQAAPYYFIAKELTQKPIVIQDVPADMILHVPGVPAQAAVLSMLINEYGDVDRIVVENSLLPDSAQKIVIDAFSKIRFHPGEIRGVSVKSQIKIEVILTDARSEK